MKKLLVFSLLFVAGALVAEDEAKVWPTDYWNTVISNVLMDAAKPKDSAVGTAAVDVTPDRTQKVVTYGQAFDSRFMSFADAMTALPDFNTNPPGGVIILR